MRIVSVFANARPGPGPDDRPGALILLTVLVLTPFFYWLRADTIGVSSLTRHWTALTSGELGHVAHNLASAVILGAIPLLAARYLLGFSFGELGLGKGRWRRGAIWVAVGVPIAILAGKISAGEPEMRAVYPLNQGLVNGHVSFVSHALTQLLYYAAWEILFRGVLLQGLTPRLGFANANMIQMALSVLAHFGRPCTETMSAIPAGLAFGGVARHTGSVWYVVLIHWVVGTAQDAFILYG
jgi:membrane protease YdiL (CAAX protease family)